MISNKLFLKLLTVLSNVSTSAFNFTLFFSNSSASSAKLISFIFLFSRDFLDASLFLSLSSLYLAASLLPLELSEEIEPLFLGLPLLNELLSTFFGKFCRRNVIFVVFGRPSPPAYLLRAFTFASGGAGGWGRWCGGT